MKTEQQSDIQLANERVTITEAFRIIGYSLSDWGDFSSSKMYCPFGEVKHQDGGMAKALRVYPGDNTAYCFACSQLYTPVKLYAEANDVSDQIAAEALLGASGYVPPDLDSRWEEAIRDTYVPDTDALAEALKVYCARIDPEFEDHQFEENISSRLRTCLGLLPKVRSEQDATLWLTKTKEIMRKVLGEPA